MAGRLQETETEGQVKSEITGKKRDISSPSPSSSVNVPPAEHDHQEHPQPQPEKRIRVSKKEIPDYKWTDEGTTKLTEFVKRHPQLYDKKQKDWLNVTAKNQLWTLAGEEQDPLATGKRFFPP